MTSLKIELDAERIKKRNYLYENGFKPPYRFNHCDDIGDLRNRYQDIPPGTITDIVVVVHGRIMGSRDHGGIKFLDIFNARGEKIQTYFSTDCTNPEVYLASDWLDVGDWIGVTGHIMKTKRGELSIRVRGMALLAKCLSSPPNQRKGLRVETRLRRPWYNLRFDDDARKKLFMRTDIKKSIRRFMDNEGFTEIDTPIISRNYGGANARPFTTWCNALDEEIFLSISPEPYLKEAISGGFEKVYTIAKNFRNEDIDPLHNPEFEMLECYQVGADYNDMMTLTENLISKVAKEILGTTKINYQGTLIDLTTPWKRITMEQIVLTYYNLPYVGYDQLVAILEDEGIENNEVISPSMAMNYLFEERIQNTLIQPTFILDYPEEISPLTREHRSREGLVERFELFICKTEFANAYSELNDPEEQEQRLLQQEEERKQGNLEAYPLDWDFIDAINCGFPTTGGLGIGIDRLIMLLTDSDAIRDIILSPMVRTLNTNEK